MEEQKRRNCQHLGPHSSHVGVQNHLHPLLRTHYRCCESDFETDLIVWEVEPVNEASACTGTIAS